MYKSTPTLHMSAPQWVISKLSTSGAEMEKKTYLTDAGKCSVSAIINCPSIQETWVEMS